MVRIMQSISNMLNGFMKVKFKVVTIDLMDLVDLYLTQIKKSSLSDGGQVIKE